MGMLDRKITVLIVENDPGIRETFSIVLQKKGYAPICATSGKEAFEFLQKNHADVVLMELLMPELEGFNTVQLIRDHGKFKNIPIIACSTYSFKKDEKLLKFFRIDDFLEKPIPLVDLCGAIEKVLHKVN